MRRSARIALSLTGAALLGVLASEGLYRSPAGKEWVERICSWSSDFAASYGIGLHGNDEDLDETLIAKNLRTVSREEVVGAEEIEHEFNLLRAQFGNEAAFANVINSSELTETLLREELADHLRGRKWIEQRIAPEIVVTVAETEAAYAGQTERFALPQRFRASHIFLAAPEGSPQEVFLAKQSAIQGLAVRILAGETLSALAFEASEDEATKTRGGDLGYFSATRMLPEFIAEIEKLSVGGLSAPFRSQVGFHIVQLTEVKPPGRLGLEEARLELQRSLGNEKRSAVVTQLREQLRIR